MSNSKAVSLYGQKTSLKFSQYFFFWIDGSEVKVDDNMTPYVKE